MTSVALGSSSENIWTSDNLRELFNRTKNRLLKIPAEFRIPGFPAYRSKFTMETEEKGQRPFLDVLLSKQSASDRQSSFITSVYRKKTSTGLLTNYFRFAPFKYKYR